MFTKTTLAAAALLSMAVAIPMQQLNKRDVTWETKTHWDVTTIDVTTTVWLGPGETAPAGAETAAAGGDNTHVGHHHHKSKKTSTIQSTVTVQPASPSSPPEQSSPYVAPTPTPSTPAPAPAPTTTPAASPSPSPQPSPPPPIQHCDCHRTTPDAERPPRGWCAQVSLPGHICAVVMTTLVLEGWSSALDPQHSVLEQVDRVLALSDSSWGRRVASAVDHVVASGASMAL